MADLTYITRIIGAFLALLVALVALLFVSLRVSSQSEGPLQKTTMVIAEGLHEINSRQMPLLIDTSLGDAIAVERDLRIVSDLERGIAATDRRLAPELRARIATLNSVRDQVVQLLRHEQRDAALKLAREKWLPLCDDLEASARRLLTSGAYLRVGEAGILSSAGHLRLFLFALAGVTGVCLLLIGWTMWQTKNSLGRMGRQISEDVRQLAGAAAHMSSVGQAFHGTASEQPLSPEQASALTERAKQWQQRSTRHSREAAERASEQTRLLKDAGEKMAQLIEAMRDISASSQRTSGVVRVLDEIAFRANILSMNATVEAARAGEAGETFSAVAVEVRDLARRCGQAAKDTSHLVQECARHSHSGQVRLDDVAAAVQLVADGAAQMQRLSSEITEDSEEQTRSVREMSEVMLHAWQVLRQTAASVEEGVLAAARTAAEAEHLQSALKRNLEALGLTGARRGTEE